MPVYIASQIVKPDRIACFVSKAVSNQLKYITNSIKTLEQFDEIEIDAFDFDAIYNTLEMYVDEYTEKDDEIIVNFTGGTKIQSIGIFQKAMELGLKAIYINSERNEYLTFQKGKKTKVEKYSVTIDPVTYLKLSGHELYPPEKMNLTKKNMEFLEVMKTHFSKFHQFLRNKKPNRLLLGSIIALESKDPKIKLIHKEHIFFEDSFPNVAKSNFNKIIYGAGFWLEYLSNEILKSINFFDKTYLNLRIKWKTFEISNKYKNEIDIIAMKETTPFLFECKTRKVENSDIDKLIYLRNEYFGRYSKLFIIALEKPTTLIEKMKDAKVEFILFSNLEEYFKNKNFTENPNIV